MDREYVHIRSAQPPHFYRAGRKWTYDGQVVDPSIFTAEEIKALTNEPRLVIRPATDDEIAALTPKEPDDGAKSNLKNETPADEPEPDDAAGDDQPAESAEVASGEDGGDDQPAEAAEGASEPRVPMLADPDEGRCVGLTAEGTRCSLSAREGFKTCRLHASQEPESEDNKE